MVTSFFWSVSTRLLSCTKWILSDNRLIGTLIGAQYNKNSSDGVRPFTSHLARYIADVFD